jgi:hypothetical protein
LTDSPYFPIHVLHVIQQKPFFSHSDIGFHSPGEIAIRPITSLEYTTDEGDARMKGAGEIEGGELNMSLEMIGMDKKIEETTLLYHFQERLFLFGFSALSSLSLALSVFGRKNEQLKIPHPRLLS